MSFKWKTLLFLLPTLLFLSGCATLGDPEASQEFKSHLVGEISPGRPIGQTFYFRRPGLNRVQLWIQVPEGENLETGTLTIELYRHPSDTSPLRSVTLSASTVGKNFPTTIYFPPLAESENEEFYLHLGTDHATFKILGRNEDQYPHGQAWMNFQPQSTDLAFRMGYLYGFDSFLNDLTGFFTKLHSFLILALVLWLPGRVLLLLTGVDRKFDWGGRTALSIGISISTTAILLLWTTQVGFQWTPLITRVFFLFLTVLLIIGWIIKKPKPVLSRFGTVKFWLNPSFLLLIMVILTSFLRLIMVRDMATSAWVDSVHHALISRLIYENGTLPMSYAPVLAIQTANYHAGFHSNFAFFLWLSGEGLAEGLLMYGQVLNAMAVLSTYLFTVTMTRNRTAGIVAGLVAAVFSPMPAYYTSWGRYTQLAGMVILPAAFSLFIVTIKHLPLTDRSITTRLVKPGRLGIILLTGWTCAGLFLTHYRVMSFLGLLFFSYVILSSITLGNLKKSRVKLTQTIIYIFLITLFALLFSFAWWPQTLSTLFKPSLAWGEGTSQPLFGDFSWKLLTAATGIYTLVVAALGWAWAVFKKQMFAWVLLIWIILMFFVANLGFFGFPGFGFVNNTSVVISLFLPISCCCGYVMGWIYTGWKSFSPPGWKVVTTVTFISLLAFLSYQAIPGIITIINPSTILSRQADLAAIQWIENNIRPGEKILINPFAWGYGLFAGGDGGYWISALTNQPTDPPPVLYGLDYTTSSTVSETSQRVLQSSGNPGEVYEIMISKDIKYLYIGAKGGLFSPEAFLSSSDFSLLYSQDGTWLFEAKP